MLAAAAAVHQLVNYATGTHSIADIEKIAPLASRGQPRHPDPGASRLVTTRIVLPDLDTSRRSRRGVRQPHEIWVLFGQLGIIATVFLGFGVLGEFKPKVLILLILLCVGGTAAFGPHQRIGRVVIAAPVVGMTGWWIASYFWTSNVFGWYADSQKFIPMVLACVVFAGVLPLRFFKAGLVAACHLAIAYTVLALIRNPGAAMVNPDGSPGWRGAFIHKNQMAPFMVFAVLTISSLDDRTRRRFVGAAIASVFILMSHSTTSLAAGLVTAFAWWFVSMYRKGSDESRTSLTLGILGIALLVFGLFSSLFTMLVELGGKDPTLTSRTVIWSGVVDAIREQPWQGYGAGGVWVNPAVEPTSSILRGLGFNVSHAHNGFLEVLVLLGIVGLVLLIWLQVFVVRLALRNISSAPAFATYSIVYVFLTLVLSFSEVATLGVWLALLAGFSCIQVRLDMERLQQLDPGRTSSSL